MRTRISESALSIRHVQRRAGGRVVQRLVLGGTLMLVPLMPLMPLFAQSAPVSRGVARAQPDSARLWVRLEAALYATGTPALRQASITQMTQRASQAAARGDSLASAEALLFAGVQYYALRRPDSAQLLLRESRALYHAKGARDEEAQVLEQLADRSVPAGQRALADTVRRYSEEAQAIFRALQRPGDEGRVLAVLGHRWVNVDTSAAFEIARTGLRLVVTARDLQSQKVATRRIGNMFVGLKGVTRTDEAYYVPLRDSAAMYIRQTRALAATVRDTSYEAWSLRALLGLYSPSIAQPKLFRADSMNAYVRQLLAMSRRSLAPKQREEVASHRLIAQWYATVALDSALAHARTALAISRAQEDSGDTFTTLGLLAFMHQQAERPDSTIAYLRERTLYNESTPEDQIRRLMELADAYSRFGLRDSTTVYQERVLAASEELPLATKTQYQRTAFAVLSSIRRDRNDLDSAQTLANRFASVLSPGDTAGQVQHLIMLGRIQEYRDHPDSSEAIFLRALPLARPGVQRAEVLQRLAYFDLEAGRMEMAIARRREALAIAEQMRNQDLEADILRGLAEIYETIGQADSILSLNQRALQRAQLAGDRQRQILALLNVSDFYGRDAQWDSTLAYGKRALALASTMDARIVRADALEVVGGIFSALGQVDSATFYLEQAIALNREFDRDMELGWALAQLAGARYRVNTVDSTKAILRQVVTISARIKNPRMESSSRYLLSLALQREGVLDSSLAEARKALATDQTFRDDARRAYSLLRLGGVFAAQTQADSARVYLTRALELSRRTGIRGVEASALYYLAELYRDDTQEHLSIAVAYYDSSSVISEGARRRAGDDAVTVSFADRDGVVYNGWALAWAGIAKGAATARSAQAALGAVERGRSQALTDMIVGIGARKQLAATARARPAAGADLAVEVDSLLAPLRRDKQAALSYLVTDSTLVVWLLAPDGSVSMTTTLIDADELRVMVRSARRAFGADGQRSAALAPNDLDPVSKADSIAMLKRDAASDLRRLASLLLPDSLEARVPAGTPIVIVPSGRISLVPFAALESNPQAATRGNAARGNSSRAAVSGSRLLGLRNPLRFAPSFAALRATEARPVVLDAASDVDARTPARATRTSAATGKSRAKGAAPAREPTSARGRQLAQALVVGNPSMPSIYSGRFGTRAKLQPLPGAFAEAQGIASQLGSSMLTGAGATETVVRGKLATAPIVHFATHGMAYGSASSSRGSYVAFAADTANDGLLTVGELMDDPTLVLHAELVVLSACQTGLGNLSRQEGTVGLQRAFLAKGARSVLVSLWNVDDAATRVLMERFYAYWLDTAQPHTKAEALQMAQRDLHAMPRFSHPKYWAGFQLVGAN